MNEFISRRRVLVSAASLSGVVGSTVLAGAARAGASNQLNKQDVQYQDQPKGRLRCVDCANFLAPLACRVVTGTVSPNGWCLLFKAKAS